MKLIMQTLASLMLVTAGSLTPAHAGQQASAEPQSAHPFDVPFVQQMAQGGATEVALGRLAIEQAGNVLVKQFGQRMVDDHGKSGDELKKLAAEKKIVVHAELNEENRNAQLSLAALQGAAFDRSYMAQMVAAHQATVARLQQELRDGADPDIKAFAQRVLPTVEDHLRMAIDINAKVASVE